MKAVHRTLGHAKAPTPLDAYADLFDGDVDDVADSGSVAAAVAEAGTASRRLCCGRKPFAASDIRTEASLAGQYQVGTLDRPARSGPYDKKPVTAFNSAERLTIPTATTP